MLEISVGNFFITSNFGTKKLRNEMILLKASMSALFDCKMSNDSLGSWGLLIYIFHHSSCHLSAIMPPHHYLPPPPFPPLSVESQQRERMYRLSMRSRSSLWILICEAKIRLAERTSILVSMIPKLTKRQNGTRSNYLLIKHHIHL